MQENYQRIKNAGLGLAAISYDSPAVLLNFASRRGITFPLLSDTGSAVIRSYGILNASVEKTSSAYGIPYPGIYYLDSKGVVKAKYFEDDYRERQTAAAILFHELGVTPPTAHTNIAAKHARLSTSATSSNARMGHHLTLMLDVTLPPGVHVYAPGVKGYLPIDWTQTETPAARFGAPNYPPSKTLLLPAIHEQAPVYEGSFRLTRELIVGADKDVAPLVNNAQDLTLQGAFRYQACDDEKCYLPESVPLSWTFHFEPLDRTRAAKVNSK